MKTGLLGLMILVSGSVWAGGKADPLVAYTKVDRLQQTFPALDSVNQDSVNEVMAEGWVGFDRTRFWWEAEAELEGSSLESGRWEGGYQRAISAYWNSRVGARYDIGEAPHRGWLAVGVEGLAPFFIETSAMVYVDDNSHVMVELTVEKELLITQRLHLVPELEMSAASRSDAEQETGSGLTELSLGIRLAYEVRPRFAPYLAIDWSRKFGKTSDFAEDQGLPAQTSEYSLGVQFWF